MTLRGLCRRRRALASQAREVRKFDSNLQTLRITPNSNSCELEEGRCGTMSGNFTRTGAVTLLALFTVKLVYVSTISSLWYNCSVQLYPALIENCTVLYQNIVRAGGWMQDLFILQNVCSYYNTRCRPMHWKCHIYYFVW